MPLNQINYTIQYQPCVNYSLTITYMSGNIRPYMVNSDNFLLIIYLHNTVLPSINLNNWLKTKRKMFY